MKRFKTLGILLAGLLALAAAKPLHAADPKMIGIVTKVVVAEDGKSAVATLKSKGKLVEVDIADKLTLDKFASKKIQAGDEIRCVYQEKDGRKKSVSFKKTAGC
ncbi:MAG: hypothetical protein IPH01_03730 [Elusimicrobia bacterium]|nr:hypothetical protein [Elusimicrobiota bacterium]